MADSVTLLSVGVNCVLCVVKVTAGILGHSQAMIADAVHTLSDFATDFTVLVCMRLARKPKDRDHTYGHGKYETLAAVLVGAALFGLGGVLGWEALGRLWEACVHGRFPEAPGMIAFWAALISVLVKEILYRVTVRVGRKTENPAVVANAWHHRSDALSSVGAMLGIGAAAFLGGKWALLDTVAALIVSLILAGVAFNIIRTEFAALMDGALPEADVEEIRQLALAVPGVREPHNLRTRRVGNIAVVEIHFRVAPEMPVREAHRLASGFEDALRMRFGPETISTVHVEPEKEG